MTGLLKPFLTEKKSKSEGIQRSMNGGEMYADKYFNPHLLRFLRTYSVYICDFFYFLTYLESLS